MAPHHKNGSLAKDEMIATSETINRIWHIDERTKRFEEPLKELAGFSTVLNALTLNTAANTIAITLLNTTMNNVQETLKAFSTSDGEKWTHIVNSGKGTVPVKTLDTIVYTLCGIILVGGLAWFGVDLKTRWFETQRAVQKNAEQLEVMKEKIEDTVPSSGNLPMEGNFKLTKPNEKEKTNDK